MSAFVIFRQFKKKTSFCEMTLMMISQDRHSMSSTNLPPQFFFYDNFISEDVSLPDLCLVKNLLRHLIDSWRKPKITIICIKDHIPDFSHFSMVFDPQRIFFQYISY